MTLGPIDFLALEFPGNKFDGSILASLLELVQAGVIRIIDLVVIVKDQEGSVIVRELQELDPFERRLPQWKAAHRAYHAGKSHHQLLKGAL